VIDHPLDCEKYLVHACLEGPEAGVYYRGTAQIKAGSKSVAIYLADYVQHLAVDFTVYVTPMVDELGSDSLGLGSFPKLLTTDVHEGKFTVYSSVVPCDFSYLVMAKRQDIMVEPEKALVAVKGTGPYTYF
jgi:hypothetical protein